MHKTLHKIAGRNKTKDLAVRDNRPILYIDVLEVKDVAVSMNKLTHIYCVVQIDDIKFVTNVQPVAKSATSWNESFIMSVDNTKGKIKFSVYKNNLLHKDRCKGTVEVELNTLLKEDVLNRWFPLDVTNSEDEKDALSPGQIRLKLQYSSSERGKMNQLYDTISLEKYNALQIFFERKPIREVCIIYNHNDIAPTAQELGALFQIFIDSPKLDLTDVIHFLVEHEIDISSDPATLFRNNTLPCKGVTAYLALFGGPYVRAILGDVVNTICANNLDLEVDPIRLKQRKLPNLEQVATTNMGRLLQLAQGLLFLMASSIEKNLPFEIREILHFMQVRVVRKFYREGGEKTQMDLIRTSVSAFLFLRFLCPALVSPQMHGLTVSPPSKEASRSLMIMSKILLNLSCAVPLPEDYMKSANEFMQRNSELMSQFVEKVSSQPMRRQRSKLDLDEVNILWSYYTTHKFLHKNLGTIKEDYKANKQNFFSLKYPEDKKKEVIETLEEAYDIVDLLLGAPLDLSKKMGPK